MIVIEEGIFEENELVAGRRIKQKELKKEEKKVGETEDAPKDQKVEQTQDGPKEAGKLDDKEIEYICTLDDETKAEWDQ